MTLMAVSPATSLFTVLEFLEGVVGVLPVAKLIRVPGGLIRYSMVKKWV